VNVKNAEMAANLVTFLTSDRIQKLIGDYGVADHGMALFSPCTGAEPSQWLRGHHTGPDLEEPADRRHEPRQFHAIRAVQGIVNMNNLKGGFTAIAAACG
jgi:hypothetical protein